MLRRNQHEARSAHPKTRLPARLACPADRSLAVTGYRSRTTLWRKVKAERFPAPINLDGTAVRWKRGEVEAWIAGEPRQTYQR